MKEIIYRLLAGGQARASLISYRQETPNASRGRLGIYASILMSR